MQRTSPPTDRVIAVLNLLADLRSEEGMMLSQVARKLDISTSTCGVVLASLLKAGYVERGSDLSYRLGPGLLPVAQVVYRRAPILGYAELEMQMLVRSTEYPCTLSRADVGTLSVVAVQESAHRTMIGVRAGDSFPLRPPYGATIFAFMEKDLREQWILSGSQQESEDRDSYQEFIADVRGNGFAAWSFEPLGHEAVRVIQSVIGDLSEHNQRGRVRDELIRAFGEIQTGYRSKELREAKAISVSYLGVPIFDANGFPRYQLELHILERELPSDKFWNLVTVLKGSAKRLTERLGGNWENALAEAA